MRLSRERKVRTYDVKNIYSKETTGERQSLWRQALPLFAWKPSHPPSLNTQHGRTAAQMRWKLASGTSACRSSQFQTFSYYASSENMTSTRYLCCARNNAPVVCGGG